MPTRLPSFVRILLLTVVVLLSRALPAHAQSEPLLRPQPTTFTFPRPVSAAADDAQEQTATFGSIFSGLGRDFTRLPTKSNLLVLGLGGALALAAHPADSALTSRAARSEPLDDVFEIGAFTGGGWVQVGGAFGTYFLGRLSGNERMQSTGADLAQAQILNAILTQGVKLAVARTRPDHGRFSFPSGHASATFATATVLQRRFGWKLGLPAYTLASYVSASRLQENRHYASDVIFGAALGIVAGRTVTIGKSSARLDISPLVIRGGGGVSFTRSPRSDKSRGK